MILERTALSDVMLITPRAFEDERGSFCETWNQQALGNAGLIASFVQDNTAVSRKAGTVRGLHYQLPPKAQGKLVRVVKGAILDIAVDIRRGSPTFGRHVRAVLSGENRLQIWIPPGFAHGLVTLQDDTEVLYKVTDYYAPDRDRGILWNDPALEIDWGLGEPTVLSSRDAGLPLLRDADVFD